MMPVVPFPGRVVVASASSGLRRGGALMIVFMSGLAPYKGGPTGREVEARPVLAENQWMVIRWKMLPPERLAASPALAIVVKAKQPRKEAPWRMICASQISPMGAAPSALHLISLIGSRLANLG